MAQFVVKRDAPPLVKGFEGYGVQLNQNVFAPITAHEGITNAHLAKLPGHVKLLAPQFVRIFFNQLAFTQPQMMKSFRSTVDLAQDVAATINITWQGGGVERPRVSMGKFARVLSDVLAVAPKLKWVTIQNEPNRTRIEMGQYARMYEQLHAHLHQLGIRDRIKFMGGDITADKSPLGQTQDDWFRFLGRKPMSDLLAAHSVHIYFDHFDPHKLVRRLQEVHDISVRLPPAGRKPLFVTEYGIRGFFKKNSVPVEPGLIGQSGPRLVGSKLNAFQHAWFNLLAATLGYHGLAKWDAYFGRYDNSTNQEYGLIGRPDGGEWVLRPSYEVTRLFTHTVKSGWNVLDVDGPSDGELVSAYEGPNGELAVIGLHRKGGLSESPPSTPVRYHITGLPHPKTFQVVYWNRKGGGKTIRADPIRCDTGALDVEAPLHSVFAVTTLPHPL